MICGHQLVTLQRGGDDQAVGRVTVHVRQKACPGRDPAIDGDFDQSLIEQIAAPGIDPKTQIKMAFLDPHADFPEGNGRNGHTAFLQRALKHAASSRPQPRVALLLPQQNVSVEEYQNRSSPLSSVASNHSAGIGETMSPRIRILSRWRPNNICGLLR